MKSTSSLVYVDHLVNKSSNASSTLDSRFPRKSNQIEKLSSRLSFELNNIVEQLNIIKSHEATQKNEFQFKIKKTLEQQPTPLESHKDMKGFKINTP